MDLQAAMETQLEEEQQDHKILQNWYHWTIARTVIPVTGASAEMVMAEFGDGCDEPLQSVFGPCRSGLKLVVQLCPVCRGQARTPVCPEEGPVEDGPDDGRCIVEPCAL